MMRAIRPLVVALLCLTYFAVPTFARRTITVTEKLAGGFGATPTDGTGTTTNVSTYTSGQAFAIASGAIGLCFVENTDGTAAAAVNTLTHNSVTWTSIATQTTAATTTRLTAFWKAGSQASSTIAADYNGDAQTGLTFMCYEVAGADTTTPVIQFDSDATSAQTTHTLSITGSRVDNSVLFFAISAQDAETWTPEYAGVGCTVIPDCTHGTPTTESKTQWDIDGADTDPTWTTGTTASGTFIAVEIAEAAAAPAGAGKRRAMLGIGNPR